ncbi:MAG: GntP family permease, partial [Bacillota bacterium]
MTGIPLIIVFIIAIVLMILAISKFKIHPFLSIMAISILFGLVAGIPLASKAATDSAPAVTGLTDVIGAGFSGTFTSIGLV